FVYGINKAHIIRAVSSVSVMHIPSMILIVDHFQLLLFMYIFYSVCHHRDLHSFPTRRSSDPPGQARRGRQPRGGAVRTSAAFRSDRKSTRLNSSHVSISYAVCCLKKKK